VRLRQDPAVFTLSRSLNRKDMKKHEEHEEGQLQQQLPVEKARRRDPCAEMPIK
jgi:hypothetical protein